MNLRLLINPTIICLLSICCISAQAQNRLAAIDSFYSIQYRNQLNGTILLAENGTEVYRQSFGLADFRRNIPNSASTPFNLASISKVITATAILQLMEKGKLTLQDPFVQYFPSFPYPAITIRHLLTHTSGLPDLELYESIVKKYPDSIITNNSIIPALQSWQKPLAFEPGDKWRYCNTNFDLLALLVEKISRMPFSAYLDKYIFKPAGMKSSFVNTHPAKPKGAIAYVRPNWYTMDYVPADSIERFRYINYNLGGLVGSTNIITTVSDMLLFDQAVFNTKLLKKTTLQLAFTPVKLNDGSTFYEASMDTMLGEGKGSYGLGWDIFEQPGFGISVGHGGFNYGLATFYFHRLNPQQTIISFDNTASPAFGKSVTSALYLLNGKKGIESSGRQSLARVYGAALKEKGIDAAATVFNHYRFDSLHYYISEREINWLGYDLMRAGFDGHLQIALEVFKINTLLFPASFNAFDSYGEALAKAGKNTEAVMMYSRSLHLNPENKKGAEALQEIKRKLSAQ
ncbi:MAG: serine hydrolase domain-containing protein [Chitinophagaceae bacterium]